MTSPTTIVDTPRQETHDSREGTGPETAAGTSWGAPVALGFLSLIPVVAGLVRVLEIAGGPHLLPANPRIDAVPAPVVVHIIAAAFYAVFGSLQCSARLRQGRPNWHRRFGRLLVGAGILVALSGLWMTLIYPRAPGGDLLWAVRLLVATAMAASIVLGFTAIQPRDITAHRAAVAEWVIRRPSTRRVRRVLTATTPAGSR